MSPSVYILISEKDGRTYVGYSSNLEERLKQHNSGKVKSTKHRRPLKVLLIESFETALQAKEREQYWKSGAGRSKMKDMF